MKKNNYLKKLLTGVSLVPLILLTSEVAFSMISPPTVHNITSDTNISTLLANNGDAFYLNNTDGVTLTVDQDNMIITDINNMSNASAVTAVNNTVNVPGSNANTVATDITFGAIYNSNALTVGSLAASLTDINYTNQDGNQNTFILFDGSRFPGGTYDTAIGTDTVLDGDRVYSNCGALNLYHNAINLIIDTPNNPRFSLPASYADVDEAVFALNQSAIFENSSVFGFSGVNVPESVTFTFDSTAQVPVTVTPPISLAGPRSQFYVKYDGAGGLTLNLPQDLSPGILTLDNPTGDFLTVNGAGIGVSTGMNALNVIPTKGNININTPVNTNNLVFSSNDLSGTGGAGKVTFTQPINAPAVSFNNTIIQPISIQATSTWGVLDFHGTSSIVSLDGGDLNTNESILNGPSAMLVLNSNNVNCPLGSPAAALTSMFSQGIGPGRLRVFSPVTGTQASIGGVNIEIGGASTLTIDVAPDNLGNIARTIFTNNILFDLPSPTDDVVVLNTPTTFAQSCTMNNPGEGILVVNSLVDLEHPGAPNMGQIRVGPATSLASGPPVNSRVVLHVPGVYNNNGVTVIGGDNNQFTFTNVNGVGCGEVEFAAPSPGVVLTQNFSAPQDGSLIVSQAGQTTDVDVGSLGGGVSIAAGQTLTIAALNSDISASNAGPYTLGDADSQVILTSTGEGDTRAIDVSGEIASSVGGTVTATTDRIPEYGGSGLMLTNYSAQGSLGSEANPLTTLNINGLGNLDISETPGYAINANISDPINPLNSLAIGAITANTVTMMGPVTNGISVNGDMNVTTLELNHTVSALLLNEGNIYVYGSIPNGELSTITLNGNNVTHPAGLAPATLTNIFALGAPETRGAGGYVQGLSDTTTTDASIGLVNVEVGEGTNFIVNVAPNLENGQIAETFFTQNVLFDGTGPAANPLTLNTPVTFAPSCTITPTSQAIIEANSVVKFETPDALNIAQIRVGPPTNDVNSRVILQVPGDYNNNGATVIGGDNNQITFTNVNGEGCGEVEFGVPNINLTQDFSDPQWGALIATETGKTTDVNLGLLGCGVSVAPGQTLTIDAKNTNVIASQVADYNLGTGSQLLLTTTSKVAPHAIDVSRPIVSTGAIVTATTDLAPAGGAAGLTITNNSGTGSLGGAASPLATVNINGIGDIATIAPIYANNTNISDPTNPLNSLALGAITSNNIIMQGPVTEGVSVTGNMNVVTLDLNNTNTDLSLNGGNVYLNGSILNGAGSIIELNDNNLERPLEAPPAIITSEFAQGSTMANNPGIGRFIVRAFTTVTHPSVGNVRIRVAGYKTLTIAVPPDNTGQIARTMFTNNISFGLTGPADDAIKLNSPATFTEACTITDPIEAVIVANDQVEMQNNESLYIGQYQIGPAKNGVNSRLIVEKEGDYTNNGMQVYDGSDNSQFTFKNVQGQGCGELELAAATLPGVNLTQAFGSPQWGKLIVTETSKLTDVSNVGLLGCGVIVAPGKILTIDAKNVDIIASQVAPGYTLGDGAQLLFTNTGTNPHAIDVSRTIDSIARSIITAATDLAPFGGRAGLTITNNSGLGSLGSLANRLISMNFSGIGNIDASLVPIYANDINVSDPTNPISSVQIGQVTGNNVNILGDTGALAFTGDTNLNNLNFNHKNVPSATVADGKKLGVAQVTGGDQASLEFLGDGMFSGIFAQMKEVKVGGGNVRFRKSNVTQNIDNIYGTGNGTLTFALGTILTGGIDNNPAKTGSQSGQSGQVNVKLKGNTTILGEIGATLPIGDISFADGVNNALLQVGKKLNARSLLINNQNSISTSNDIQTQTGFTVDNGTAAILSDIAVNGPAVFNNANVILGSNVMTLNGAAVLTGSNTVAVNVADDGSSTGRFAVGSQGLIDASGSNWTNLQVSTPLGIISSLKDKRYKIFDTSSGGGYAAGGKVVPSEQNNSNVDWIYDNTDQTIRIVDKTDDNLTGIVTGNLGGGSGSGSSGSGLSGSWGNILGLGDEGSDTGSETSTDGGSTTSVAAQLTNPTTGDPATPTVPDVVAAIRKGSTDTFLDLLASDKEDAPMVVSDITNDKGNVSNVVSKDINNNVLASVLSNTVGNMFVGVSDRISSITSAPPNSQIMSNVPLQSTPCSVSGISSGDCGERLLPLGGVWVSPFYGHGRQKGRASNPYKMNSWGVSGGVDGFIDEHNLVGIGAGYLDNKLKYSGRKKGDNTRVKSQLVTAYWHGNLPGDNFAQLIGNVARHKIDLKDRRGTKKIGYSLAKGKTKGTSYGIEGQLGHSFKHDIATLTPVLGLRHSNFKINKFTDSGSSFYNLYHGSQKSNVTQGFAGLKASSSLIGDNIGFTPEVHGFVYRILKKTSIKPVIRMVGAVGDFPTNKQFLSGTSYNVGVGTGMVFNDLVDGSLSYDLNLGKKYIGHQIGCKLRVLF